MTAVVDALLQMLEKDVIENSKACAEYFEFFKSYASYVSFKISSYFSLSLAYHTYSEELVILILVIWG